LRRITLAAEKEGLSLGLAIAGEGAAKDAIYARLEALGIADPREFFRCPELYRGKAPEKARAIGEKYRAQMGQLIVGECLGGDEDKGAAAGKAATV